MGQALPKDNYTLELYNNGFLYVKKPSGEAVQIDGCTVLTSLKAGGKMMQTSCLMSSDQSTIVILTFAFGLKSYRLKIDSFEVQAALTLPTSELQLHRDGKVTLYDPYSKQFKDLFNGGLEDDEYTIHITNNGTIQLNGSDGLIRWELPV
jgi:hypothetical protein